jgi:hypothetical protein
MKKKNNGLEIAGIVILIIAVALLLHGNFASFFINFNNASGLYSPPELFLSRFGSVIMNSAQANVTVIQNPYGDITQGYTYGEVLLGQSTPIYLNAPANASEYLLYVNIFKVTSPNGWPAVQIYQSYSYNVTFPLTYTLPTANLTEGTYIVQAQAEPMIDYINKTPNWKLLLEQPLYMIPSSLLPAPIQPTYFTTSKYSDFANESSIIVKPNQSTMIYGHVVTGGTPPYKFAWYNINGTQIASTQNITVSITSPTVYEMVVCDNGGECLEFTPVLVTTESGQQLSFAPPTPSPPSTSIFSQIANLISSFVQNLLNNLRL